MGWGQEGPSTFAVTVPCYVVAMPRKRQVSKRKRERANPLGRYTPPGLGEGGRRVGAMGWWDPETGEDVWIDLVRGEVHRGDG